MGLADNFRNTIDSAMDKAAQAFALRQQEQMNRSVYRWNGTTVRQNGEVVSSPRDIVDTGKLRNSLESEKITQFIYEYRYPVPYAAIVHEGGKTQGGNRYPSRPWIEDAFKSGVIEKTLDKELK